MNTAKVVQVLFVTMIISLSCQFIQAQVNEYWVNRYNGPSNKADYLPILAVDVQGNVIISGTSYGNGTSEDYLTIKYSPEGIKLWEARYNGSGNSFDIPTSVTVDKIGNVYVTGYSNGVGTSNDYLTIKYNSSGVQKWLARYNGPGNGSDQAISIATDKNSNVYVTGSVSAANGYSEFGTIKYDSAGIRKWIVNYSGPTIGSDFGIDIAIDSNNYIYVCGNSTATTVNPNYEFALIKYTSNGGQMWVARYNPNINLNDGPVSLSVDAIGNSYMTGTKSVSSQSSDCLTFKYNTAGELLWVDNYDFQDSSDYPTSLDIDKHGNTNITGSSKRDYFSIKYDPDGVRLWTSRYSGAGYYSDVSYSIVADTLGNAFVTGSGYRSPTKQDIVTLKYNSSGQLAWQMIYNGPSDSSDEGNAIAIDPYANILVASTSKGSGTDLDFVTIKYSTLEPAMKLLLTLSFEGMYYPVFNSLSRKDTVRAYLRLATPPYNKIDSATSVIDSISLSGAFFFHNAQTGNYYLAVKHFNSVETWSKVGGENFVRGNNFNYYDFTTSAGQAYGSNQTLKGSKYCIYSGDINQSGFIDGSDAIRVHSDSRTFLSGYYMPTDLNADGIVDASDYALVDNNAYNFIGVVKP